jgi:hypothetical protein
MRMKGFSWWKRKVRMCNDCITSWTPNTFWQRPQPLLGAILRPRVYNVTISGIHDPLNYSVVYIIYKFGRWPHNITRLAAVWTPVHHRIFVWDDVPLLGVSKSEAFLWFCQFRQENWKMLVTTSVSIPLSSRRVRFVIRGVPCSILLGGSCYPNMGS